MAKKESNKRLTLVEMLLHLKELSDTKSDQIFFETAYTEFKHEVLLQEKLSHFYIARGYLKSIEKVKEKIVGLDIFEVIETLQNRIDYLLSKRTDIQKKYPVMADAHIADISGS